MYASSFSYVNVHLVVCHPVRPGLQLVTLIFKLLFFLLISGSIAFSPSQWLLFTFFFLTYISLLILSDYVFLVFSSTPCPYMQWQYLTLLWITWLVLWKHIDGHLVSFTVVQLSKPGLSCFLMDNLPGCLLWSGWIISFRASLPWRAIIHFDWLVNSRSCYENFPLFLQNNQHLPGMYVDWTGDFILSISIPEVTSWPIISDHVLLF